MIEVVEDWFRVEDLLRVATSILVRKYEMKPLNADVKNRHTLVYQSVLVRLECRREVCSAIANLGVRRLFQIHRQVPT